MRAPWSTRAVLSGCVLGCLALLGAKQYVSAGYTPAPAGCTPGPTTNMVLSLDSIGCTPGTWNTWNSGVGGITATGSGSPTCTASIFGSVPAVRFTAATPSYYSLSSGISAESDFTIMVAFKTNGVTSGVGQAFTGRTDSGGGEAVYQIANSALLQSLDKDNVLQAGTGTASFSASTFYQSNVTYISGTSTINFRLNKAADTTQSPNFGTAINVQLNAIGWRNNFANSPSDVYLGAIYIFTPHLALGDIQTWETDLSCAYPGT